jgi:hypothetical protein
MSSTGTGSCCAVSVWNLDAHAYLSEEFKLEGHVPVLVGNRKLFTGFTQVHRCKNHSRWLGCVWRLRFVVSEVS